MKNVLVTGGAGFIGSHVVSELVARGFRVTVLDDLSGGDRENVHRDAELVVGSVADFALVDGLFERAKFDYCFHFAAYAAEGLSHFVRRFNYENNLLGSVSLINASVRHSLERFVFASSIAVYGDGPLPMRESDVVRPVDPYGISKYAVELDLAAAHELFGLEYTIFRPHNVYGERQNMADRYRNVVGIFMAQAKAGRPLAVFGDGLQTRAFSYVGDVVGAMVDSLTMSSAKNEVFNVGSDEVTSVNELIAALERVIGVELAVENMAARVEVKHAHADHQKFHRVFGAKPTTQLEQGLARMWSWAKDRPQQSASRVGAVELTKNLPASWRDVVEKSGR